ncbi:MAG TPA: tripartite tricarboxylate transporter TctB family protein [Paraburkholderia sp.]|jgi:hypothetical protein|nr:tripartite tricarboxylate transporter TctB family protein [Paraburkholderia sp.]
MRRLLEGIGKDTLAGGLMLVVGLGAALQGMSYSMGTLAAPGPGLFPAALGVLLMPIGIAIALFGKRPATGASDTQQQRDLPRAEWRGWFCIVASIVAFIVLGNHGGLVPASFAVAFIAALGDRDNRLIDALVLGVAMAVVAVVVFWWLLQLQFPLFQWG